MTTSRSRRVAKRALHSFLLAALLIASVMPISHTRAEGPAVPPGAIYAEDDGGTPEVGVEWITDWPGTADDRANWYYSAVRLRNELDDAGWVVSYSFGNASAWERDYKRAAVGTGIEQSMIDAVDLAFIGTHGTTAYDSFWNKNLTSVYFSSNNDDWFLVPGEGYRSYGNNDLEWLAFDSCSVLRDDSRGYWHATFDGLHLMLGFANTMYVVYPGDGGAWGDQMRQKGWWIFGHGAKTVTQAWFSAVEDQQPSGVRARVLAEELDSYNDYIWGQGYVSPDYPNNGSYWYWDHVAGTPPPLQIEQAPMMLPVVVVVPRTVNEDYVRAVGAAFGLSGQVLAAPDGSAFYMAGGPDDAHQLRVDALSGGFLFQNLDQLWTKPETARTLPSGREAAALALSFLRQHDDLPGAFFFDPQIPPTIEVEGPIGDVAVGTLGVAQAQQPTDIALHYGRTIDVGGGLRLSIVGPGSRQNLYLGDGGAVIGMKGGWREVQLEPGGANVPIITADEAWAAFLADPSIALAKLPLATSYDTTGKPAPTLAYYELALSQGQAALVPVWLFVADLYAPAATTQGEAAAAEDVLVASDASIYVPAASDGSAAVSANITSPTAGTTTLPGTALTLAGTASGGTGPYTYEWSSSLDGLLGTGATLQIPGLNLDLRGGEAQPNVITLRVRDTNGLEDTATVALTVLLESHLPLIRR